MSIYSQDSKDLALIPALPWKSYSQWPSRDSKIFVVGWVVPVCGDCATSWEIQELGACCSASFTGSYWLRGPTDSQLPVASQRDWTYSVQVPKLLDVTPSNYVSVIKDTSPTAPVLYSSSYQHPKASCPSLTYSFWSQVLHLLGPKLGEMNCMYNNGHLQAGQ